MLIKANEAIKKENTSSCIVWEYNFPIKELWFATALINWRYPNTGKAVNHECDELYYIISGNGIIHDESGDYPVHQWDCFLFEKQKWYRVEGTKLNIALPTSPAWFLSQYKCIQ